MAVLVLESGPMSGATFLLGQRALTIGRGPVNLVQVVDSEVSRRHALVRWTAAGTYALVDLQSQNGTFLNEQRVDAANLSIGDRIRVGQTVLRLETDDHCAFDETVGPRRSGPATVDNATRMSDCLPPRPIEERWQQGRAIDLDAEGSARALRDAQFVFQLTSLIARGRPPRECLEHAARGVLAALAPERVLLFRATPEGTADVAATAYAEGLDSAGRRAAPNRAVFLEAWRGRKALFRNELPPGAGAPPHVASVGVAPILSKDGARVAGLVYADSFADNPASFIADDLDILRNVATALQPLFA
jgi:pSer/pThr/pTyr-binding forkhead associated (FHA) protein